MSGHSKWSTIKRQKGAADIKRGQTFTKIANMITLAAKQGGGDAGANPKLRDALDKAKDVNMPKDNIQRAIDRGLGKLPGQVLEEVTYEGFGPAKVAFYMEGVTDNKLRTNQKIRSLFERSGGSLAGQGSVAYMFNKVGEIKVNSKGGSVEEELLNLIDLGAEDVEDYEVGSPRSAGGAGNIQKYLVYVDSSELNTMGNKITQAGYEIESKEISFKPNTTADITDTDTAQKVINLAENLEEDDDIQKVYANFNLTDEVTATLGL